MENESNKTSQSSETKEMKKAYLDTLIHEEVEKKIYSIDSVRQMRIIKSQRLYEYAEKWKRLFFWMNLEAVVFLIVSLVPNIGSDNNIALIISGIFSLYTILLQYYIDSLNFNERALRLHYHQLQLEQFILELKELIFKWQDTKEISVSKYLNIMRKYQLELGGYENHDEIDRLKSKGYPQKKRNIFMICQIILMFVFLIVFIALCFNLLPFFNHST